MVYTLTARLVCVGIFNSDIVSSIHVPYVPVRSGVAWFMDSPPVTSDWITHLPGLASQPMVRINISLPRLRYKPGDVIPVVRISPNLVWD